MRNQPAIQKEEEINMNSQYKALNEMRRLTSPFRKARSSRTGRRRKRVIGYVGPAVPEEMIHAAKMLALRVSGDNEPIPTNTSMPNLRPNVSTFARSVCQNGGRWQVGFP